MLSHGVKNRKPAKYGTIVAIIVAVFLIAIGAIIFFSVYKFSVEATVINASSDDAFTFQYSLFGKTYTVTEWERLAIHAEGDVGTAYYHLFDPANASMELLNNLWNIPAALASGFFWLAGLVAILAAVSNHISLKQHEKKKTAETANENNPD